jgi:uncharacterized protein involved in exopolysaccharide biosynthesis
LNQSVQTTPSPTSHHPSDALEYTQRHWLWIVFLAVVGTCIGWLFSLTTPARYEAQLQITLSLDLSRTGTPGEEELEMVINAIGNILDSPSVRHQLLQDAQNASIPLNPSLLSECAFVERKNQSYVLRVRWSDPQQAAWLVNRWGTLAFADLQDAENHALAAESLQRHMDGLSGCLAEAAVSDPAPAICPTDLSVLQTAIQETSQQILMERQAGRGFFPGLRAIAPEPAEVPQQPVQFGRGNLIVAGCLLGVLAGILALWLHLPDRLKGLTKHRD